MDDTPDLRQMLAVAKYQFLNYVRSRRLLALAIITLLIGVIYVAVMAYVGVGKESNALSLIRNWAGNVSFLGILGALFFGGDAIAGEYSKKTGYFLFPQPVKRDAIIWGKYLASYLAALLILLLYWGMAILHTLYYFSEIPVEALYSVALTLLFLASILSLTYLFSALFKNGTVATVMVAILYFFAFSIINSIAMFAGVEPWFSITYASAILTAVLQKPYPPHKTVIDAGVMKVTAYTPTLKEGILILLAYFVISIALTLIIMRYKEMK